MRTNPPSMTPGGERPRSKTMVGLDLSNAYARLGVSPLLPTDEIKEIINRKRKEVMRRRRTRGEQQFGEEEAEMTRLQAIEDEIGAPKARARYDRLNPQNALLTIQPAPSDLSLDARHRAGLATAWLIEALGRSSPLPSPESLPLWVSQGLDPDLIAYLSAFARTNEPESEATTLPDVADLERFGRGFRLQDDLQGPGDSSPDGPLSAGGSPDG